MDDIEQLPRLDMLRLTLNLGGSRTTVTKLLHLYLDTMEAALHDIRATRSAADMGAWLQAAHRLKGSSQNVMAKRMAALCRKAEEIQSLEEADTVLADMESESAALRVEITRLLAI